MRLAFCGKNWLEITAALFAVGSTQIGAALADRLPHMMSGPFVYYSTDMSPVEVWLGQVWYRTDDEFGIGTIDPNTYVFIPQEPIVRAKIPRAYLTRAEPYSQSATHPALRHDVLPDHILSSQVTLSLTYPDRLPYSVVYETWPEHKPDLTAPGMGIGIADWQGTEKQTRAIYMAATVRSVVGNVRQLELLFKPDEFTPKSGEYDGFNFHIAPPTNWQYYYDDGPDEIRQISCTASVDKSLPFFYCDYAIPLNSKLYAVLKFLDFRFHGGREFARERVRVFKQFACPIFHCDEKALKAAQIRGSSP